MSLFQTKRWWGFNVEGEDELDQDCLIHGDLSNTGELQVSMGTFNGRLMVFKPAAGDYQVLACNCPRDRAPLHHPGPPRLTLTPDFIFEPCKA